MQLRDLGKCYCSCWLSSSSHVQNFDLILQVFRKLVICLGGGVHFLSGQCVLPTISFFFTLVFIWEPTIQVLSVCEISWCRCQQLTALSISTALVTKLLVIEQLLHPALKSTVSAPWHNLQFCPSSQQIPATPLFISFISVFYKLNENDIANAAVRK